MANQKYAQVVDLLATGRLDWSTDDIVGVLLSNATFDTDHTLVSQAGTTVAITPLPDRSIAPGGECWGSPLIFELVQGDADYQVVLAKNDGSSALQTLAFYDLDAGDDPIHVISDGTLIVRPAAAIPDTTVRLWMKY